MAAALDRPAAAGEMTAVGGQRAFWKSEWVSRGFVCWHTKPALWTHHILVPCIPGWAVFSTTGKRPLLISGCFQLWVLSVLMVISALHVAQTIYYITEKQSSVNFFCGMVYSWRQLLCSLPLGCFWIPKGTTTMTMTVSLYFKLNIFADGAKHPNGFWVSDTWISIPGLQSPLFSHLRTESDSVKYIYLAIKKWKL